MKRKWRLSRIGIMCILVLLLGYAVVQAGVKPWKCGGEKISGALFGHVEEVWLPGFSYEEKGGQFSLSDMVARSTSLLVPLGSYVEEKEGGGTDVEDAATYEMILSRQAHDENEVGADGKLISGKDDSAETIHTSGTPIDTSIEKMSDFNYLLSNFYTVDSTTMIRPDELKGGELMAKNMKIDQSQEGPKILIYHTHSQEMFADSVQGDESTSIVGIVDYLTSLLNDTYHIPTLHHKGVYDLIDGKLDRSLAYDMAKPDIQKILEENPTIEVVIDLHRDGVGEGTHLVTEVNGKQTAQIMFFNGLSKTRANGEIDYLANPYIQDNLAFSLQMQVAANNRYPGFARRIYLRGYRYNMHFMPKSLLVEAGAQTNTVQEMKNAMEVLADLLNTVLTG